MVITDFLIFSRRLEEKCRNLSQGSWSFSPNLCRKSHGNKSEITPLEPTRPQFTMITTDLIKFTKCENVINIFIFLEMCTNLLFCISLVFAHIMCLCSYSVYTLMVPLIVIEAWNNDLIWFHFIYFVSVDHCTWYRTSQNLILAI
jgi:hypothetical protein